MTVLQMQCFLEAAELGSFAVASEKLYISQPTMSRQIRTLEEELQVALFVRDHNAVKLTDIGRELLPMIQSLYAGYMGASKEIQETVNRRLDRLRIGILDSLSFVDPMREAVLMVKHAYPNANIQICHLPLRQSCGALRDGSLDVLFMLNTSMASWDRVRSMDPMTIPMQGFPISPMKRFGGILAICTICFWQRRSLNRRCGWKWSIPSPAIMRIMSTSCPDPLQSWIL